MEVEEEEITSNRRVSETTDSAALCVCYLLMKRRKVVAVSPSGTRFLFEAVPSDPAGRKGQICMSIRVSERRGPRFQLQRVLAH